MINLILLSCFTIMASAVPVRPNVLPPLLSQGEATQAQRVLEATNQLPYPQTPAPLSPNVGQPQPGVPQLPSPQDGHQFLPHTQHYTWYPLGGSPMIIPLQPSFYFPSANQPTVQQPLTFPPYRYFPLFSTPYMNQLLSPYGYPMILESPLQRTPAGQPPNSPVVPAVTPSGAAPSGDTPQPGQQQQNAQIVYTLQQPKSSPLGSLSSEELQMAAKMGQLGVYLTTVLTNSPAGASQPVNQGAGLVNPEQQSAVPTVETSSAGVQRAQGQTITGPQPNTNGVPVGLEKPVQEATTVSDCSHRQS